MKAFYSFFITKFRQSEGLQTIIHPHLLINFVLISISFSIVYALLCWLIQYIPAFYLNIFMVGMFALLLFLFRTTIDITIITHAFVAICLLGVIGFSYFSGGVYSIVLPWFAFIPVTAFLLLDLRAGFIWLTIATLAMIGIVILGETKNYLSNEWRFVYSTGLNIGLVIIIAWITSLFSLAKDNAQGLLKDQNLELKIQKEEMLVQNEELIQQREEIIAQRDFIEAKNTEMQFLNNKLGSSEKVLKKAVLSLKESQEKIKEKNIELEQRDRFIQKSIQSAVTIQEAILPYQQKLDDLLKNYFIISKPYTTF